MTAGNVNTSAYHRWLLAPVRVGDRTVSIATKPGVLAHGVRDPAAMMLAEWISVQRSPVTDARSLHVASGNGLVPAMAQMQGYAVTALDRYAPNAQATRRTLGESADVRHAAWPTAHGGAYQLATVRIPADKLSAQLAVVAAYACLEPGALLLVAGGNDEGIKPVATFMERHLGMVRIEAQHSGHRLLAVTRRDGAAPVADDIAHWLDPERWHAVPVTVGGTSFTCFSRPGVFSWLHLDEATALLGGVLQVHPVAEGAHVLDLGCGTGALGVVASRQSRTGRVVLLDADAEAVRSAEHTLALAGCSNAVAMASDVTSAVMDERFDVVVSNPPFHVGKGTDLEVPRAFIDAAHEVLTRDGRFLLVANRTLPYERWITERFGAVHTLHDGRRFKVLGAVRR